jgi:SdpC family antimicrobial peptide
MWFRSRLKSVIAVMVASASLAYALGPSLAWASGGATTAPAASAPVIRYDGETLFRGLFFRQGPIGQNLPDLAIAPAAPTGDGITAVDTLIAQMRKSDPGFFDRFATGIQSGNRLKILAAVKDAQAVFDNALVTAYHAVKVAKGGQIGYCVFGPILLAVAAVVVLVYLGAGVVVLAVAAAAVVVWVYYYAPAADAASRLKLEKWVNQIALSPLGSRSLAAAA